MRVGYQKYPLYFGVFCGFFLTLQAFQGTFKKTFFEKPLKISLKTRQLLKESVVLQKTLLPVLAMRQPEQRLHLSSIQSMIALSEQIANSNQMTSAQAQKLSEIIDRVRNILFQRSPQGQAKVFNVALQTWWNYLLESLKSLQAEGCEFDKAELQQQIMHVNQLIKAAPNVDSVALHSLIAQAVGTCSVILQHFDGFFVTEYDVLVLGNLILALVALDF